MESSTTKNKTSGCCDSDCCTDEKTATSVDSSSESIKEMVKEKYGQIALQSKTFSQSSCCGGTGGCGTDFTIMSDEYAAVEGYNPDADLGLGCGVPTQFAKISKGNTVLDLGSGAGNDAFVARSLVGENGKVIGVDMTEAMVERANINVKKLGYSNVEFRLGDIEKLPVESGTIDVVISNCVLNLVPNKRQAFGEIYRVLKSGAHFTISDIVLKGQLPKRLQSAAEMYAGCVAGALQMGDYLGIIHELGFKNVSVVKEKKIIIPDEILSQFLSAKELIDYKKSDSSILSITVYADK